MSAEESPNKTLDKTIKEMLKASEEQPFDLRLKALNTAIQWERAKHAIMDDKDVFNSEDL